MPRATKPKAAPATAATPSPSSIPPAPVGALPGGPQPMAPQFAPQQGYAMPQPQAPFQGFPPQQPQVDVGALMTAATQQTTPPPAPAPATFTFPQNGAGAPPLAAPQNFSAAVTPQPQTQPLVQDSSAAATVLPQILGRLDQLAQQAAQQHGEATAATGSYNQARSAEFLEIKKQFTTILDHLGGIGEVVNALAKKILTLAPEPVMAAPVLTPPAAPQFSAPAQPPVPAAQASIPAPQQIAAQSGPTYQTVALSNVMWQQAGARNFAYQLAQACNGRHYNDFLAQVMSNSNMATCFGTADVQEFAINAGLVDTNTGIMRV